MGHNDSASQPASPVPPAPHQPACPAFNRWMQRRVLNKGRGQKPSCRPTPSSPAPASPAASPSTFHSTSRAASHAASLPPALASARHFPLPSDEELTVAHLQELKGRLRCRNPFLNQFLVLLQQDPAVSSAWITPLPHPDTPTGREADAPAFLAPQPFQWVRPIDDLWRVALQAARDPMLSAPEREMVFVATLVKPLLETSVFKLGWTHEDIHLVPRIRAARQACSVWDEAGDDLRDSCGDALMQAQAMLLKGLLVPGLIDLDADQIHPGQYRRLAAVVERALWVLALQWSEPEAIKPLARTRLAPSSISSPRSGHATGR